LRKLKISITIKKLDDCYGCCEELEKRTFLIEIDNRQTLKDFVMTIMHEMVHVKQYIRNEWIGDGEAEAWNLQESMTEKFLEKHTD
tara:strand:+ start:579 stop:836 length:258 start_codon:yes stop_codon:yes gene_type:complete